MIDEPVQNSPLNSMTISESTHKEQKEYINEIKTKPKINSSTFSEEAQSYSETTSIDETRPKRVLPSKTMARNKMSNIESQSSIIDT